MTKTGNYLYGFNRNSSGLHGAAQNHNSVDGYGSETGKELWLKAGDSGHCEREFDIGTVYEGFHFITDSGVDKLIVHAKYPGSKHYNKNDFITKSAWNHFHRSTLTQNGWVPEWCISDESEVIYTSEGPIFQIYAYSTLPKYQNLDAVTGLPIITKSMKITGQLKIKMNGAIWNVRETPSSTSKDIGDTKPNEELITTEIETEGQVVNGNSNWFKYGAGWVAFAGVISCTSIGNDAVCQAELTATRGLLGACNTSRNDLIVKVDQLTTEVNSFVPEPTSYVKKTP